MEVADRIAVMDHARLQQVGTPKELYEEPANPFVMGFVGAVNRLGDSFVRPHDLELRQVPNGVTHAARVERVTHLGFEVRVELEQMSGGALMAQLTRDEAEELGISEGDTVHVAPRRERVFAGGDGI